MLARHQDPIAAIATALGRGAVGIVRVSGCNLNPFVQSLCGRQLMARAATYTAFLDHAGRAIDRGIAIYFPAPHSFTGEDVLELQAHGGPVLLQLLLARCLEAAAELDPVRQAPRLAGLRIALPGEFSERAFLNNKIDLAQAEAIADLVDASTEAAARSASLSLSGVFSQEIQSLRDALIELRTQVEALLDFPEEEIDFLHKTDVQGQLSNLQRNLQAVLQTACQGALLREGIKVVIAGQPNVGKSSLLNALAGAELAIVTPIAGTTRDKVHQTIQIEGVPVHVIDTAGLRASADEIEKIGIAHAWDAIETADAVLFLHDLTRTDDANYEVADAEIAKTLAVKLASSVPIIDVWNKVDAVAIGTRAEGLLLSAKTGFGLDTLRHKLLVVAGWQSAPEGVYIARARHVQALRRVADHLMQASAHLVVPAQALELLAEELRLAQNALSEITGEFTSDELLGEIFSKFCIGK
jgi:tRNA modification GTPase